MQPTGSRGTPEAWRDAYRRRQTLDRAWAIEGAPPDVARDLLRRALHGRLDRDAFVRELRSLGLPSPAAALLDDALALREMLADLPDGRRPDDPYDNVFQAVLDSVDNGFWTTSPDLEQVYRGQRNAEWSVVPSLFRSGIAVDAEHDRLRAAVHALRASKPEISDEQTVALAQHYSRELGVRTWLIDVTFEPRVAFFFASHGGETGEIGVVTCIVRNEWEMLNAGGRNRLGAIRLIEVPNVLRLERQRALFLDTSHPDLFEQYVPYSIWFRQHTGVMFEDDVADPAISECSLYPPADDLLDLVRSLDVAAHGDAIGCAPASDAGRPLAAKDYHAIAESWCELLGVALDPYRDGALQIVCAFHALVQQHRDRIPIPQRSLLRLYTATERVCDAQRAGDYITPAEALDETFARATPETAAWMRERLNDCISEEQRC